MSLKVLLNRDTVNVKRAVTAQTTTGARTTSYTAAARGSLPKTWKCRIQEMTADERLQYGIRGNSSAYKFLSTINPKIDERDQIDFVDSEGVSHTVKVLGKQRNADNQGLMFQVNGEESSTEE